ncbi:acyl-CoA dehydrogenase [Arthrobacter sp. MYb227]|uniref:acyl-CoA dehydrogenase family protein n=1 Tax=Arthrobacter sp. MYb227 TaxID=1848601 RepID=UPI000CFC7AE8|nr:acyl-CoA dehydrogenase family protein [Arthrobacter sp. MYb227]PQZ89534.1 acyl-CoA dehydrogenase [Arthrobacter sp. MYb227]
MALESPLHSFDIETDPNIFGAVSLEALADNTPARHLLKLTPGIPTNGHYDELAAIFRPVFAQITTGANERDAKRILPFEQVGWLNKIRFGALRIPENEGGYGASLSDLFRLLIELAEADSHVAHLWRAHFAFVESVLLFKDLAVRGRWTERISGGQIIGNAYTERGGNTLGTLNTKLDEHGDRLRVTGEKYYCTGTIYADWVAVAASHPTRAGRQIALVSTQHSGVKIYDDWDGFGQQLTGTGSTTFDSVPVDTLLPEEQQINDPESAIFQLVLLAVQAGITRAALNDVRSAVQSRTRTFSTGTGVPVRNEPQVLQLVGEISATAFAVDSVVLAAVGEIEIAVADDSLSAVERFAVCELAANRAQSVVQPLTLSAATKLFDGLGASATASGCNLDRHWRNARTVATHNPAIYKSRIVGDYEVNGTAPKRLNAIGDLSRPQNSSDY